MALVALAATAVACGSPWQLIRQATPNPFLGNVSIALAPMDTSSMTIDDEVAAAWLAHQSRDDASSIANDIIESTSYFTGSVYSHAQGALVSPGTAAQFVVRSHVIAWTRGSFGSMRRTHLVVAVHIVDQVGRVLDHFRVERSVWHPIFRPTPVQGLEVAMENCGTDVAQYIRMRRTALLQRSHEGMVASSGGAATAF